MEFDINEGELCPGVMVWGECNYKLELLNIK